MIDIHSVQLNSINCDICEQEFSNEGSLKKHTLLAHSSVEESLSCDICGTKLKNEDTLKHHMRYIHDKNTTAVSLLGSTSPATPQSLIRRRSPRNSTTQLLSNREGTLAPAMLHFNMLLRHHRNKRMRKSTEAQFKDMLKDFECHTMSNSTPLRKKYTIE